MTEETVSHVVCLDFTEDVTRPLKTSSKTNGPIWLGDHVMRWIEPPSTKGAD
jgi:hypothetical protein